MLNGHGIEPNIEDAIYWLNKATNLGEARAYFTLGEMYANGVGLRTSLKKANELFIKSAELNDPSAQLRTALRLLQDLEIQSDE
jgi:TPR repeat protein